MLVIKQNGQLVPVSSSIIIEKEVTPEPTSGEFLINGFDSVTNETLYNEYRDNNYAYTLPSLPDHTDLGLTAQGWSCSQSVVDGAVTVNDNSISFSPVYKTTDGKCHFYVTLTKVTGLDVTFRSVLTGYTNIEWGDGSEDNTLTHTFTDYGDYVIKVSGVTAIANGSSSMGGIFVASSSEPNYFLTKVYFSDSVTSIGEYAFYYCRSLTSITIPDSVTSIGNSTFTGCSSLTSITIGNSVTSIEGFAFYFCHSLTSITIPSSVVYIEFSAFKSCYSLTSITISNNVTSIGTEAFQYCHSLTSITIPDSVTSIGDKAFNSCYVLTNITIPNSVTSIGRNTFEGCSGLTSVTISNSVTSIGDNAFYNCRTLKSIIMPKSITSSLSETFRQNFSLISITIPNGVTSIGYYAFHTCYSLTNIKIPDSVTSVGTGAFYNCYSIIEYDLTAYTDPTAIPTLSDTNAFTNINGTCKMLVSSQEMYDAFTTATNWSSYADYFEIKEVN